MTEYEIDELIDESIEGKHARRNGKSIDDNPHPPGTKISNAWLRGWRLEDLSFTVKSR